MGKTDYYTTLELERNASSEDIKSAFRRLALKYHPDRQHGKSDAEKDAAAEKFKEINEAYSVLSDPQKKEQYDRFGSSGFMNANNAPNFDPSNLGDFIRHMHGDFNSPFEDDVFFRQHNMQANVKGQDIRIKIECTLEDAYNGISKKIKYNRQGKCHHCNGSGSKSSGTTVCTHCGGTGMIRERQQINAFNFIETRSTCPHCGGTGVVMKDPCRHCNGSGLEMVQETVTIDIPKGVQSNMEMVINGMGNLPPHGQGIPGDLKVVFIVKSHNIFVPVLGTSNLSCKTDVSVIDCILGTEKEITCIDGSKVTITIPQGIKDKDKVIVSKKGMPTINTSNYGDMIVYVNQIMPKSLSKDERTVLEGLRKNKNFKI